LRAASRSGRPVAAAHARLGVRVSTVDPGACSAVMDNDGVLRDPDGRLAMGALLVVADAVLGIAIGTALPAGRRIATLRLRISMVDTAAPDDGPVIAHAGLRALSPDTGLSSGTVEDATGRLLARISTRCAELAGESLAAPEGRPYSGIRVAGGMAEAWDASVAHLDDRGAVVTGRASAELSNNGGIVQGGALGALAEFALSRTLTTASPALRTADAQDLELTYLRGVPADDAVLTCRTTVQHAGSRLAAARAELAGADGRTALLATATRYADRR
jgi:uncharacterized protein (TIGR00369 family)